MSNLIGNAPVGSGRILEHSTVDTVQLELGSLGDGLTVSLGSEDSPPSQPVSQGSLARQELGTLFDMDDVQLLNEFGIEDIGFFEDEPVSVSEGTANKTVRPDEPIDLPELTLRDDELTGVDAPRVLQEKTLDVFDEIDSDLQEWDAAGDRTSGSPGTGDGVAETITEFLGVIDAMRQHAVDRGYPLNADELGTIAAIEQGLRDLEAGRLGDQSGGHGGIDDTVAGFRGEIETIKERASGRELSTVEKEVVAEFEDAIDRLSGTSSPKKTIQSDEVEIEEIDVEEDRPATPKELEAGFKKEIEAIEQNAKSEGRSLSRSEQDAINQLKKSIYELAFEDDV